MKIFNSQKKWKLNMVFESKRIGMDYRVQTSTAPHLDLGPYSTGWPIKSV